MANEKTILLTGATGLLGSRLVQIILKMKSKPRVLVLLRGNPSEAQRKFCALLQDTLPSERTERVELVLGDLERPGLGLEARTRAALTEQITHVIHAAASISFSMPYAGAHAVNYDGTRRVLELAAAARQLQAFAHISTAYVAGCRTGVIREQDLVHDAGFVNNYERTKYEAEELVRARMSELPISVYRTATIIGNSVNGAVRQFNYFHDVLRSMYLGLVPFIPGDPAYAVDVIPEDWAAETIRYLVLENFHAGNTYHLCSGPKHSLELAELVDATFQVFAAHSFTRRHAYTLPPIVPYQEYQSRTAQAANGNNPRLAQLPKAFSYFISELTLPKLFDSEQLTRDLPRQAQVPDIRTYYSRVVEFCLATRWGRARYPGTPEPSRTPAWTHPQLVN